MLGIKYIKFDAMTYVVHYKNGKIVSEGRGLSFFYFGPSSSIVAIPMGSNDVQFIFNELTGDFQTISIQGSITYKIENPKQLAEYLDFTVDEKGKAIYVLNNNQLLKVRDDFFTNNNTNFIISYFFLHFSIHNFYFDCLWLVVKFLILFGIFHNDNK